MSMAIVDSDATRMREARRSPADVKPLVQRLRRALEADRRRRARRAGWSRRFIPTGLAPLDAVLPHGGLPRGAVVEILSHEPGVGAMLLTMRVAESFARSDGDGSIPVNGRSGGGSMHRNDNAVSGHRPLVMVDTLGDFYPPAAQACGIALQRMFVIRARNEKDALWAVDQSLRCSGVAVVIAPLTELDERGSRRLQLAAESSGGVGLILRPARRRSKSFAAVRLLVEGVPVETTIGDASPAATHEGYPCRITLLSVREGTPGEPLIVDLHHETGVGSAFSLPVHRPVARTG